MKKLLVVVFALAITLTITAPAANADVLFNNTGNSWGTAGDIHGSSWFAQSFSTNSSSYNLSSVVLDMSKNAANSGTAVTVSIYTNTGSGNGQPGSLVGNLTSPGIYTAYNTFTNTTFAASGITLNPNSVYWVVLKAGGSDEFFWGETNNLTGTGAGFRVSYSITANSGGSWGTFNSNALIMQVNATPTPLPASLLLFAPGLAGLAALKKRFNHRRQTSLHKTEKM